MSFGKKGKMFRRDPHAVKPPPVEDLRFTDPSVPSRSCCCPAPPVVKVTMPPTADSVRPADLWLCGHHYRASLAALLRAGANVEELTTTTAGPPPGHAAAHVPAPRTPNPS
jgi:hypothetical protein